MSRTRSTALTCAALLVLTPGVVALGATSSSAASAARAKNAVAAAAVATGCQADEIPEVGSLDADNFADVAVGVGGLAQAPDLVDAHLSQVGAQRLQATQFSGGVVDGDVDPEFGTSLASIDLDHDGCSELVVGAPDLDSGDAGIGAVDLLSGSPTGLWFAGIHQLVSSSPHDGFGSAVAVAARSSDETGSTDLWVGAPDRTVGGKAAAGAVDHYVVAADGGTTFSDTVTAATVGGTVHAGAHFGAVLSAELGEVVIGAPDDTVGTAVGAGSVSVVQLDLPDTSGSGERYWTQNTAGVPGTAEKGDHLGQAVFASGSGRAVVGVPGEDIGARKDAGSVQFLGAAKPGRAINQNSAGVPGTVEAGDEFGASLTAGVWLLCQESYDVAIGSPGEDIGSVKDAGSVTLVQYPGAQGPTCKARTLTQESGGLGGAVETGDRVGASLAVLRDRDDFDEDVHDRLVIGVPFEDVGSVKDAGVVLLHTGSGMQTLHFTGGDARNQQYGTVLTLAGGGPMFVSDELDHRP